MSNEKFRKLGSESLNGEKFIKRADEKVKSSTYVKISESLDSKRILCPSDTATQNQIQKTFDNINNILKK